MGALRIVVNDAMNELHEWVEAGFRQRGKNASGRTFRSVRVNTTETPTFVEGTLSAEDQWKYVGSGRGPGGQPPVDNIRSWVEARGLNISEWAVAKSIAKRGTRDWQLKNTNVFLDAIEAWEKFTLPDFEDKAGKLMEDAIVEVAVNNLKN